ncbi:MAG: hypothetical protein EOM41_10455 [Bacilli bacterium]|nr:hypothetical protein [Bacilli bacterium]
MAHIENPRPFICDGNPFECSIFITGFNATTEMKAKFDDFWSNESGFNKNKWLQHYIIERQAKPLAPNKTRRNKLSATRQRIEWLTEIIHPAKCLETNLYSKATVDAQSLEQSAKTTEVFDFLLDKIQPKLIITHGVDAKEFFELRINKAIPHNEFFNISENSFIISVSHLSRGWSKDNTIKFGFKINDFIKENQPTHKNIKT